MRLIIIIAMFILAACIEEQADCEEQLAAFEMMSEYDNRGLDEPALEQWECDL